MTDKRIRMECPFYHTLANQIQVISYGSGKNKEPRYVVLKCQCGCTFTGSSKQEVIDKWNCR